MVANEERGMEFFPRIFTNLHTRRRRVFIHRFHRFPQMGKRGVLRNLKESGTGILLRTICANLCNLWITHPALPHSPPQVQG